MVAEREVQSNFLSDKRAFPAPFDFHFPAKTGQIVVYLCHPRRGDGENLFRQHGVPA